MGISYSAELRFGIALPDDYFYEYYGPEGAGLEEESEWYEYEYPSEALEAHISRLAEGVNLCLVTVGYLFNDETERHILALKEPIVSTANSDDYYTAPFDPDTLDVGEPSSHLAAIAVAKKLDLDWTEAGWLLCWSVG
jgi:hypothetical protein